jgi:hypothetical protein
MSDRATNQLSYIVSYHIVSSRIVSYRLATYRIVSYRVKPTDRANVNVKTKTEFKPADERSIDQPTSDIVSYLITSYHIISTSQSVERKIKNKAIQPMDDRSTNQSSCIVSYLIVSHQLAERTCNKNISNQPRSDRYSIVSNTPSERT